MKSLVKTLCLLVVSVAFFGSIFRAQTPTQQPNPTKPQVAPSPTPRAGDEVDSDDVIRVKTSLVNSPVLVIGRNGRFVPSLKQDDFQILEDGVVQDIAYFATVENPVTVSLLLDTSRSALFNLSDIQDAALAFVDSMRPQDQAQVITFSNEIKLLAGRTSDRGILRRAIRSLTTGGNTRLYDAIDFALTTFVLTRPLNSAPRRHAVILFSDGVDNASRDSTYDSSALNIQKSEALIYPVQFNTYAAANKGRRGEAPVGSGYSKKDYAQADAYLHLLADLSGTGVYPAADISDLDRAVSKIIDELHNEYSLGYYPKNPGQPGQMRRLEVRVNQRQLIVKSRAGYVVDRSGVAIRMAKSGNLQVESGIAPPENVMPVTAVSNDSRPQLGARWICKGPNVPTDFAVVKEGFDSNCPPSTRPGDQTNAWFIRKPGLSDILCKGFLFWNGQEVPGVPVPTGYVVMGETQSATCTKGAEPNSQNAWTIRLPQGRETVCKGFMIPRGYVVVGESNKVECPAKRRLECLQLHLETKAGNSWDEHPGEAIQQT